MQRRQRFLGGGLRPEIGRAFKNSVRGMYNVIPVLYDIVWHCIQCHTTTQQLSVTTVTSDSVPGPSAYNIIRYNGTTPTSNRFPAHVPGTHFAREYSRVAPPGPGACLTPRTRRTAAYPLLFVLRTQASDSSCCQPMRLLSGSSFRLFTMPLKYYCCSNRKQSY